MILSVPVTVVGIILLVVNPSVLFKLNWREKTVKEKFLIFLFYGILVYIVNIIFWIF